MQKQFGAGCSGCIKSERLRAESALETEMINKTRSCVAITDPYIAGAIQEPYRSKITGCNTQMQPCLQARKDIEGCQTERNSCVLAIVKPAPFYRDIPKDCLLTVGNNGGAEFLPEVASYKDVMGLLAGGNSQAQKMAQDANRVCQAQCAPYLAKTQAPDGEFKLGTLVQVSVKELQFPNVPRTREMPPAAFKLNYREPLKPGEKPEYELYYALQLNEIFDEVRSADKRSYVFVGGIGEKGFASGGSKESIVVHNGRIIGRYKSMTGSSSSGSPVGKLQLSSDGRTIAWVLERMLPEAKTFANRVYYPVLNGQFGPHYSQITMSEITPDGKLKVSGLDAASKKVEVVYSTSGAYTPSALVPQPTPPARK